MADPTVSICHDLALFKGILRESRKNSDDKLKMRLNSVPKPDAVAYQRIIEKCTANAQRRIGQIAKCIQVLGGADGKNRSDVEMLRVELGTESILASVRDDLERRCMSRFITNFV